MDKTREMLTVYFEEPFWVGIFERISGGMLTVCKVTFGAEPKDYEVQEFILKHYSRLRFSPAVEIKVRSAADHPKRGCAMRKNSWNIPVLARSLSRHCSGSGKNQRLNAGSAERDRRRQRSSESLI